MTTSTNRRRRWDADQLAAARDRVLASWDAEGHDATTFPTYHYFFESGNGHLYHALRRSEQGLHGHVEATGRSSRRRPRQAKATYWTEAQLQASIQGLLDSWDSSGYPTNLWPPKSFFIERGYLHLYEQLAHSDKRISGYALEWERPIQPVGVGVPRLKS